MASKTIKGLTVEIGGDTTKLGKALKDVEAKSRSLSKELGDNVGGPDFGGVFQMNPKKVYLTDEEYADMAEKLKKEL